MLFLTSEYCFFCLPSPANQMPEFQEARHPLGGGDVVIPESLADLIRVQMSIADANRYIC